MRYYSDNDMQKMKEQFTSLGHAVLSLNPKINEFDSQNNKRNDLLGRIHNAFFYFQKTDRGSGLVELAVLLEDLRTGWLPAILTKDRLPQKNVTLDILMNDCGLVEIIGSDLHQHLNHFRKIRGHCAHWKFVDQKEIETAFWEFLLFAKWYYEEYCSVDKLFDENSHVKRIPDKGKIANRFEVVRLIGRDDFSQTYQVVASSGPKDYFFTAKRVLFSAKNYKEIIDNESCSRPLFNDNPNVGRFFSIHDDFPVGEILLFEYIDGWTLKQWIEEEHNGVITSDVLYELVYVIGGVIRALQAIHDKKYVHGFISPRSILVTRESKDARVVSFDRCTPEASTFSQMELVQRAIDNPSYSPRNIQDIGKKPVLDTFALGKTLKLILESAKIDAKIPASLHQMIEKATAMRYPTAKEMYVDWIDAHGDVRYKRLVTSPHTRVALISCSNRKNAGRHQARNLYSASDNFVKALKFAEDPRNTFDQIYIVSGRHGLVELNQVLERYDFDIKELSDVERSAWATHIISVLKTKINLKYADVTIFADRIYSECLLKAFTANSDNFHAMRNPDFYPL